MAKYRVFRGDPEHKQVALYDNFLGGMNTTDIDSNVKTNEFRLLQNVELAEEGRIQKRKGWRNYETLNKEFFANFPRDIIDIYYFNVFKDERAIFNNLDFHVGPYELWFDLIYTSGDNLFYGIYKVTRNNLNEVDIVEEPPVTLHTGGGYLKPTINEVEVLNYGGRRYLLLNQIVEDSEEIVEFYQDDEGSNIVKIMKKSESFTPNAYDANLIGFNIFKDNPLDISITTTGQSSILQTYILEHGKTIESSKLYDSIFESGKFTLAVVYSGPTSFIKSLNLKLYRLGLEGNEYINADISEVKLNENSSWAYYDIIMSAKPVAGQDIGIEFTKLDEQDITTENDEPYESYKDLFEHYHNKHIQGDTIKPNMLVNRITTNKYELMESDPDHPFRYRKLRYKDSEGNFTRTVEKPVYLSYEDTEEPDKYFRGLTSDGIIYGELGTYDSQRYNTFSVNTRRLSNSRIYDKYLVRDNEDVNVYNLETTDIHEIKNIDADYPPLEHNIAWTGARAKSSYSGSEWANILNDLTTYTHKRTVNMTANERLDDYGISSIKYHEAREVDYANNFLRNPDGTYTPNDDTINHRYNIIETTFLRHPVVGPPENLGTFSAVLVGDVSVKDYVYLDYHYSNYNDYVLTQNMTFKLKKDDEVIYVHYNGNSEQLGAEATESDYAEYFTEGTADFVTYDYNEILKVRNSEPIVIETIDFKTMKGIIINDKLVLYTHNTIIWSDDFSTRRDESSSTPVEQSFSYFPNHNWASLPLAYNDSIQKIAYYRGSWIIFTKESIYRMNGEFTADEMEIVLINDSIGCIAPGSVRGINNTLIFLTEDGLYALRQNYYQEGLENVIKIDDLIKGVIPYGTNYESIVHGEQYLLHTKDFEGNYINTIKQYYNMVNTSKTMPYTVDIYRESPVTSFRHLGSLYGFNNGQLYKYGEQYVDFMPLEASDDDIDVYAYKMIIETPDWDLEHPLHEKKYKNLFMKLNSTHEVFLNFILTFDRHNEVTNEEFTIEMNDLGELEYIRNFDPNLRTDGRMELGRGKLAEAFLGFEGYQVFKIDPSAKGRVMKIRLENNTADRIAIDAVSIVYKLGKMRESV